MDDSERSYGYSEDIYHGRHGRDAEKSYEYGAESAGDVEGHELSPEEQAIRIEGNRDDENVPAADTPEYDYGRETAGYGTVESFTWDLPGDDPDREAQAARAGERGKDREETPEPQEVEAAPDLANRSTR